MAADEERGLSPVCPDIQSHPNETAREARAVCTEAFGRDLSALAYHRNERLGRRQRRHEHPAQAECQVMRIDAVEMIAGALEAAVQAVHLPGHPVAQAEEMVGELQGQVGADSVAEGARKRRRRLPNW
jgi:hypothetical protein